MHKAAAALSLLVNTVLCAQSARSADTPLEGVVVTSRALTISIPLDTSRVVGERRAPTSGWDLRITRDAYNLSSRLWLQFGEPFTVAAYRVPVKPASCRVLTDTYSCGDSATVQIANGRLLITVHDSAMLALLFGDRPARVGIDSSLPVFALRNETVRYVAPQVLPPSKEALAEYDRALGRDGWTPWTRTMRVAYDDADDVWMQVGERRAVGVTEEQTRPIDSRNSREDFSLSGWTSTDSAVVGLAPSNSPYDVFLVARRPGKSTIAVNGLRGPSDELPRSPRVHTLTRNVIVTNRLTGIRIAPRPSEIVAGSKFALVARAIDDRGAAVEVAPVDFVVIYDTPDPYGREGKKYDLAADVDLTIPGRRRFIARFKTFADTLDVRVVPRAARPRKP